LRILAARGRRRLCEASARQISNDKDGVRQPHLPTSCGGRSGYGASARGRAVAPHRGGLRPDDRPPQATQCISAGEPNKCCSRQWPR